MTGKNLSSQEKKGNLPHMRLLSRRDKNKKKKSPSLGEEEIQEMEKDLRQYRLNRRRKFFLLLFLVAVAVLIWHTVDIRREYTQLKIIETQDGIGANADVLALGEGMVRYSQNGIAYRNRQGKIIWEYGYAMSNPVVEITENYGVVGDRGGRVAYVFDADGIVGTISTTRNLLDLDISRYGVVAVMVEDSNASYIEFFDKSGEQLDITVKNVLTETSGYPLDLAMSPQGTGLILSLVYMDQGTFQTRISFLNFDVGKDSSDRVVGYFTYSDSLFPQVEYLNDSVAYALGDASLELYSLKNEASPSRITSVALESSVKSVFSGEEMIGLILEEESGDQLRLYDANGEIILARDIEFSYTKAEISGNYILVYSDTHCLILNTQGYVKYEGSLEGDVTRLFVLGRNRLLQFGVQTTKEMRLK